MTDTAGAAGNDNTGTADSGMVNDLGTGATGNQGQGSANQDTSTGDTGTGDTGDTGGKPDGAPESYELKLPENAALKEAHLEQVVEFAKVNNLTQEQAQASLEFADSQVAAFRDSLMNEANSQKDGWLAEAKADEQFGREKFDESMILANRAFNQFASPEFVKVVKEGGFNNHPELLRTFVNIGKAMSEDKFEGGGQGGPGERTQADIMYPDQK